MKHINIPLFVPHAGCPQQCTFCNQQVITGRHQEMTPAHAVKEIETVLAALDTSAEVEIAFFGGSFTAIERSKMISLLDAVQPYITNGRVKRIRISTRPDAIDDEVLDILAAYHVQTIELGIQSMSDKVLSACRRGHTAQDSISACRLIVNRGFTLGGQMMIGLPESSPEDETDTAKAIVELGAREARIYPTVVFDGTALAEQTENRSYSPLTLDEAVSRSCNAMEIFDAASVKLLRIGLCESEGMHDGSVVGGAFHPALGELCRNEFYLRKISQYITAHPDLIGRALVISVARGRLSAAIGQHKSVLNALKSRFSLAHLTFTENQRLSGYAFEITAESE